MVGLIENDVIGNIWQICVQMVDSKFTILSYNILFMISYLLKEPYTGLKTRWGDDFGVQDL